MISPRDVSPHLAATGVAIGLYLTTKIKRNGLPQSSPWFFPIFDWLSFFYHGASFQKWAAARSRALGSDAFYVGLFGLQKHLRNTLLVTDPEEQHAIMAKENKLGIERDLPESAHVILGKESFTLLRLGDHRVMRKVFGGIISPRALESFIPYIQVRLNSMFESLDNNTGEVKLEVHIRDALLSILSKVLYGLSGDDGVTDQERAEYQQLSDDYYKLTIALFSIPGSSTFKEGARSADNNREYLAKRFESILESRRAEHATMKESAKAKGKDPLPPIGNAMETVADSLIEMGMEYEGQVKLSIIDNLSFILGASHGTTTTISTNLLYRLSLPENATALNKLREEVATVKKSMEDDILSFDNVKTSMPYAEACVKELLRVTPLSSFSPLDLPKGSELEYRGKTLRGPMSFIFERSGNYMSPDLFPRPNDFLPERWLDTTEPSLKVTQEARRAYKPYGMGRHSCLGERMANINLKIILFCFASNPKRWIDFDVTKVKIKEAVFPSYEVTDEFPCTIRPR